MTYTAIYPNGTTGEEEVGCIASAPATKCLVSIDKNKYPPGTEFNVTISSGSGDTFGDPVVQTVSTGLCELAVRLNEGKVLIPKILNSSGMFQSLHPSK